MIGSPPHTRERPIIYNTIIHNYRITPAYAGKTFYVTWFSQCLKDHPRIRGKDSPVSAAFPTKTGSPPHTRERHNYREDLMNLARITPAYAGKTHVHDRGERVAQDHPRIRGKDSEPFLKRPSMPGSPPHTRERLVCIDEHTRLIRITPAYAGKTAGKSKRNN